MPCFELYEVLFVNLTWMNAIPSWTRFLWASCPGLLTLNGMDLDLSLTTTWILSQTLFTFLFHVSSTGLKRRQYYYTYIKIQSCFREIEDTDTDTYLWRVGYQWPPIDELLARGEMSLIVRLASRRWLDPCGAGRLLQIVTPLVRVRDGGTLPKVQECLLLEL